MKQQVNVRTSEATRSKLDSLTAIYGTQAEAIAVAVDRLWQDHQGEATMKADIVSKRIDSRNARLELRSGERGTGKVLHSVTYWTDSPRSEEDAYRILTDEAERIGASLTQHSTD